MPTLRQWLQAAAPATTTRQAEEPHCLGKGRRFRETGQKASKTSVASSVQHEHRSCFQPHTTSVRCADMCRCPAPFVASPLHQHDDTEAPSDQRQARTRPTATRRCHRRRANTCDQPIVAVSTDLERATHTSSHRSQRAILDHTARTVRHRSPVDLSRFGHVATRSGRSRGILTIGPAPVLCPRDSLAGTRYVRLATWSAKVHDMSTSNRSFAKCSHPRTTTCR